MAPASRKRRPHSEVGGSAPGVSRSELRNEQTRAALVPLRADEWPAPLVVAIVVAILLAVGVATSVAAVANLSQHGGSIPGAVFLAVVLLALARGMYVRRYWAVLGFQALLAFQLLVASLALMLATTFTAAALCLLSIALGGWLFWKLVRIMGRIQAGERIPSERAR